MSPRTSAPMRSVGARFTCVMSLADSFANSRYLASAYCPDVPAGVPIFLPFRLAGWSAAMPLPSRATIFMSYE
ncbi:hypothetical protein D3C72_2375170 [compost metagenome]